MERAHGSLADRRARDRRASVTDGLRTERRASERRKLAETARIADWIARFDAARVTE